LTFLHSSHPSVRIGDFKIWCNALAFPGNSAERSPPSGGHGAERSSLPKIHIPSTERSSLILHVGIVSRFLAFPIIFCGSINEHCCGDIFHGHAEGFEDRRFIGALRTLAGESFATLGMIVRAGWHLTAA